MEVKGSTHPDVRLMGLGHFDLPVRFGKPQPEHSFDVLVQKAPESLQGSGEAGMGLLNVPKNAYIPSWRYDRVIFGQGFLEPVLISLGQLPDIPFPGRHLFSQHFQKLLP